MNKTEFYMSLIIVLLVVSGLCYFGYNFAEKSRLDRELSLNQTIQEAIYNTTQKNMAIFNLQLTEMALDCDNQPFPLDIRLYKQLSNESILPDEINLIATECLQEGTNNGA